MDQPTISEKYGPEKRTMSLGPLLNSKWAASRPDQFLYPAAEVTMGLWRHIEYYQNLTLFSDNASLYQWIELLVYRSRRKQK